MVIGLAAAGKRCSVLAGFVLAALGCLAPQATVGQGSVRQSAIAAQRTNPPPRVIQANRFLAQRGWTPGSRHGQNSAESSLPAGLSRDEAGPQASSPWTASWQPMGPTAALTPGFGLVTRSVSALALDPSDATGSRLFLGTTGGGVWVAQNAGSANTGSVVFTPLLDHLAAMSGATDLRYPATLAAPAPLSPGMPARWNWNLRRRNAVPRPEHFQ